MTSDNRFLKGTVMLTLSGLCVKFLSAVYRIPITRMIGASGMGIYSATFNIFMPFFSLALAGVTPTVSRLCAKENNPAMIVAIKRKAGLCFGMFSIIMAFLASVVGFFYSKHIDSYIIFWGIVIMCFNMVMSSFEAVYKGISQGTMNMSASAKSAVLESFSKVLIGISSVYIAGIILRKYGVSAQLYAAFLTISISGFICLSYLHVDFYKNYDTKIKVKANINSRKLFSMAMPIAFSALVVSLANFFDTVICLSIVKTIPDSSLMRSYPFISFQAEPEKAIWLFGVYQGLCLSITNLIPSLSAAIGSRGLPLITKSMFSQNMQVVNRQSEKLVKYTSFLVIPVGMFVSFFGLDVVSILYGYQGAQTVLAAYFLKIMVPISVLAAFSFPFNSILHAADKSSNILKILLLSCTVKVILSVILCSQESINIMGCIYSQRIFQMMVFFLSFREIKRTGTDMHILKYIILPSMISYILCSFLRSLKGFILYSLPDVFNTFFCGSIFVISYILIMILSGFFVDK